MLTEKRGIPAGYDAHASENRIGCKSIVIFIVHFGARLLRAIGARNLLLTGRRKWLPRDARRRCLNDSEQLLLIELIERGIYNERLPYISHSHKTLTLDGQYSRRMFARRRVLLIDGRLEITTLFTVVNG